MYKSTTDKKEIIGAPVFFPTVWHWIKKWFDPITTSKIFILSYSEVQETLATYIDLANIPKKYGGELDFEYGDMPVPDPAWKDAIQWQGDFTDFPGGPLYWIRGDDNRMQALAVGSIEEHQRKESVCIVGKPPLTDDKATNGHAVEGKESKDTVAQHANIITATTEGLDGLTLNEKIRSLPDGAVAVLTEDGGKLDVSVSAEANVERDAKA
jgi:hypothetical protein